MSRKGLGSVAGRVAVVTGAASGIGRATALLLAERGARVALCDRDSRGLRRTAHGMRPGTAFETRADVTRPDEIERLRERVLTELGPPELVVNAAGVAVIGKFLETSADDWDLALAVNLRGPALVTRAFVPAMIESARGGQIVNVASAAAFFTPSMLGAYGATKHGLVGLSQALREELAPFRIGITVVCPGFVDTPIATNARVVGESEPDASRRRMTELLRLRGLGASHVARAVVRAAERDSELVPVGAEAFILQALERLAPGSAARLVGLARRLLGPM